MKIMSRRTCASTGKTIYETIGEAKEAMLRFKSKPEHYTVPGKRVKHRGKKPEQKRTYYCEYCEGFHLTKWEVYKKQEF